MYLRPRMTRFGGHAGPYVWGGVTGVTDRDNPWLTAVQANTATRLVVQAKSYDAEQRFLVNENPLSVRTALGVGFGASGCAGPVFASTKYGPAMAVHAGRFSQTAYVSCPNPIPSASQWRVEIEFTAQGGWFTGTGESVGVQFETRPTGLVRIKAASDVDSTAAASYPAEGVPIMLAAQNDGVETIFEESLDRGVTWSQIGAAVSGAVAFNSGATLYIPRFNSSFVLDGVWYKATIRSQASRTGTKVAEFTPDLFVGGNRADGDTAEDLYGTTWTVERPAAGSDIPTDNTTRLSFDGTADFGQVVGDDDLMDFVPATGLTVLLDASFGSGAASGAVFASSANATTDDGIIVSRNGANERIQGRVDDGATIATVGDNADNITYDTRFQAAFAFGNSDHEAYVDGVSVETATDAVGSIAAAGALRLGAEIDGSNKAAFDLYAFAVVGDDMTDTEVAATAAEGLAI